MANQDIRLLADDLSQSEANARYHLVIRWLHWLMAACFVFMWVSGYTMRNLMPHDSPTQEYIYDLHKSVGVTLIVLLVARLCARVLTRLPELPNRLPTAERRAAKAGHWTLYVLIALGVTTGWALTDFGGHGVVWFDVPMPQVFPIREQLFGITLDPLTSSIHAWLVYGLLALVVVHVAAVVKHRLKDRIDLLPRIALGRNKPAKGTTR
ncbi:cytochrome b [Rhodophyticola porphyridii]|uniref:cytochrome b n=1 Tax=Rhodophyticola porphyridii TaxID=1852017 RepID=UPI0035D0B931